MAAAGRREVYPTWWGFSPALDLQMHCLQSTIQQLSSSDDDVPELNILLVGAGDARHLLKTICQARRWPKRKLNFYIIESDLELLARTMLFLTLALENPEQMGLQEKSESFLELFGNSLIRSQTANYLQERCDLFIRCVTDPDYQQNVFPWLNLTAIKFKERDELEDIFKFWRTPESRLFPIEKYWEAKNRQFLGRRYDSRRGAYDWDLSMKLHDRGASVINGADYNRWREKGVAFVIREGIYDVPNKTLASYMSVAHRSGRVRARGYWGDIITSPYIAFGIETEEKGLLITANGVHVKSAQEITQYNVLSLFHELVTGQKYTLPAADKADSEPTRRPPAFPSSPLSDTPAEETRNATERTNRNAEPEKPSKPLSFIPLSDVEIHFLPLNSVSDLHRKSRFHNLFNLLYFSCSMVHNLKPEYKLVSARKATLVLELTKFMVDLQTEKLKSYVSIVTKVAKDSGFTATESVDWKRDHVATFERTDDLGGQPPEP
ncbi:dynein axonemal assembly factor 3 [Spea bombifrons]|uniref:dynein axonemal assembly factor 3 n=1 Tax=Spea bombifrons TaxID=233779 RepID=UPI00234B0834|nr:dynein axonemal assembly factor 3 [Spea bombifrons]